MDTPSSNFVYVLEYCFSLRMSTDGSRNT